MEEFFVIRTLCLAALAFIFAIAWTPLLTHFLYKYKMGKHIRDDGSSPVYSNLHAHKAGTPTMGGILVWLTVLLFCLFFFYLEKILPFLSGLFSSSVLIYLEKLNFLSRSETLLPLGCLVASALVGLADDFLDVRKMGYKNRGIKFSYKLLIYAFIALVGAYWFYFKLDWDIIRIPFLGNFALGWFYIPFFILVVVSAAFAVNQTDGLDGLAGGTLLMAFASYGAISFIMDRYDLMTFCGVITGALSAFLWFNITPARFFMGDTGSMSLGITLAIFALFTNTVFILPFLGIIFVWEALSTIVQLLSKKLRHGRKVFISSPIHHHFEAKGWPEAKIVMRFWVIAGITAIIGVIIFLADKKL